VERGMGDTNRARGGRNPEANRSDPSTAATLAWAGEFGKINLIYLSRSANRSDPSCGSSQSEFIQNQVSEAAGAPAASNHASTFSKFPFNTVPSASSPARQGR
jgi:hypothetical protein